MGARRVEVTKQCGVPFLCVGGVARLVRGGALRVDGVGDDAFDGRFCTAVDVGGADGAVLGDRDHVGDACRVAVDGGGRGEDNVGHVVFDHGGEERDGPADIDAVVCEWDLGGFANSLRGKAVSTIASSLLGARFFLTLRAAKWMTLSISGFSAPLAADELDAIDDLLGGVVEIVDDDNLVVCLEEGKCCERTNVASATVRESVVCCCMMELERKLRWGGGAAYPVTRTDPTTIFGRVSLKSLRVCSVLGGSRGFVLGNALNWDTVAETSKVVNTNWRRNITR
jgi:hypothetical protein